MPFICVRVRLLSISLPYSYPTMLNPHHPNQTSSHWASFPRQSTTLVLRRVIHFSYRADAFWRIMRPLV